MSKGQPIDSHVKLDHEPAINKYFRAAIKTDASDLHLKVGCVPQVRIHDYPRDVRADATCSAFFTQ